MKIALRSGAFTKKYGSAILSPTLGITFDRVPDSGSLWDLSCKGGRDGMEVMFRRAEMLNGVSVIGSEKLSTKFAYHRHLATLCGCILLVAEALRHCGVNTKAAPKQDTHFTVLSWWR